jgi:hypothetical protein
LAKRAKIYKIETGHSCKTKNISSKWNEAKKLKAPVFKRDRTFIYYFTNQ